MCNKSQPRFIASIKPCPVFILKSYVAAGVTGFVLCNAVCYVSSKPKVVSGQTRSLSSGKRKEEQGGRGAGAGGPAAPGAAHWRAAAAVTEGQEEPGGRRA